MDNKNRGQGIFLELRTRQKDEACNILEGRIARRLKVVSMDSIPCAGSSIADPAILDSFSQTYFINSNFVLQSSPSLDAESQSSQWTAQAES